MASSSSSSPSNPYVPPLMKDEESRNWAELLPELICSILLRLDVEDILENAERVCRSWRRVCEDPSMWRKSDMRNRENFYDNTEVMCRQAVDRSEGGLVEIRITNFGTDSLLTYIPDRSSNLTSLGLPIHY